MKTTQSNRRILVIDDTRAIHEDFRKILSDPMVAGAESMDADLFGDPASPEACQFEVGSAFQGQEGLELVRQACSAGNRFALAFVDVRMPPGWDGVETVLRLWEVDPDLQVVICTAHSDYSWSDISSKLGRPEHLLILKKPFDVIEVLQLAHTLTEKWNLAQQSRLDVRELEDSVEQRTRQLQLANQELSALATERHKAAQRIERLNHLYSALCKINELIVRSRSAEFLCQEACRVLTDDGLFVMAWFGLHDPQNLSVRPVAWAGRERGYLSGIQISTQAGSPQSAGPCGQALVGGRVSVCNDIATDPAVALWRDQAQARGYAAIASFPLKVGGGALGVLTLYSAEPHFFKADEVELLQRLSEDLSFALNSLEQAGQLRLQSAALTAAENSIVITDPASVILWHNPAFSQLTGFDSSEAVGRKMRFLQSGKHSADFYQELWRTISSGQPWHGEIVDRSKDGRLFTSETTITPVQDSQGHVSHYIAIQRDVTARINAERRTEAFVKLGKSLNVASTSRQAAQIIVEVADLLLGWDACCFQLYSSVEHLSSDVLVMDLLEGHRTQCDCDSMPRKPASLALQAIEQGGVLVTRENPTTMRPQGIPFGDISRPSASILFVPIRNGCDTIGIMSIQSYSPRAYDQASLDTLQALADHCGGALDRIKAQEKLKETQEQLRQSQKLEAIGQLASGVAHDFNNLLTVIRGNADLALMCPEGIPLPARDCLQQVASATERAANLTKQLLIFSRKQVMTCEQLELSSLLVNLTKMLNRIIGEHISLQCDYSTVPCLISADASMIEQVVVNLVVNARDAMPSGGQLTLATRPFELSPGQLRAHPEGRVGSFVMLSVLDSGTGIDPQVLPRIFEPFFTTKPVGKGTGLGLSTVYGIVKQHAGWIEVSSRVGAGSLFTIFLPLLSDADPAQVPRAVLGGQSPGRGSERVLLVEDEEQVRILTRRVLENFGYHVLEATSAAQAQERYSKGPLDFELLLTDIVMPGGLSGCELAERFCRLKPSLKVLFISGYSGEALGHGTKFLRKEPRRFLAKPCSSHQLLHAVRQCLDD